MFWVETCSVRVDKGQTRVQETNLRDTDYSELKRRKKRGMSITALSQVVQFQFSLRGRILQNVAQHRLNQKKTLDEVLSVLRKLEFIP